MKKIVFLLALSLIVCNVIAQENRDSLVNILETRDDLTTDEKFELYKKICQLHFQNDIEKFKTYAEEGLDLAEKEGNKEMISNFNSSLGIYYYYIASYDSSLLFMEKTLDHVLETGNKAGEVQIYTNMALVYCMLGDYATEIEYNLKALSILEELPPKKEFVTLLVNIGTTYSTLNDDDRALYYFDRANKLAEETDYLHGKLLAYYGYANVYYNRKDYEKSLEYYLKSRELSREENNKHFETLCVQSLSTLYLQGYHDAENAEKYALESMKLAEEFGDPFRLRGSLAVVSNLYLFRKNYKECDIAATQAWEIDSLDLDISPGLATIITTANIHLGNKEKAEHFLNKYIEINGEKEKKNLQETLIGMEVKYETEKKEARIAGLEERQRLYTGWTIMIVIVFLLIIILLFGRHRLNLQKRKLAEQQVKQLEQEKQLIATQAVLDGETAERSRLARDLHDGLGGMLSVVKLNLNDMKNFAVMDGPDVSRFDKALDMLDQSISELRRVAHHMMPESLMRYGLKVSLEDFCRAIPGANFQYYGEDPRLDSRLEVIIYRCAYELVNNAVKHANASHINVQLIIDNGLIALTVQDNGTGFSQDETKEGSGLKNIRNRISAYNGKINILSSEKGTEISIEIEAI